MEKDGYALIGETVEEIAREWEEFCATQTRCAKLTNSTNT